MEAPRLVTASVGSARTPGTPSGVSAGPAARISKRRVPAPAEMLMPGMVTAAPVPTWARADKLVSRFEPGVAPIS